MKKTKSMACGLAVIAVVSVSGWFASHAYADSVQVVQLETFQVPEGVPNEILDETEAVPGSVGVLVRSDDSLHVVIATKELPSGAYTFWWHLEHPDGEVSILWAGYALVGDCPDDDGDSDSDSDSDSDDDGCDGGDDSEVILNSNLPEGEDNAPGDIFIGHGLQPGTAHVVTVELWVRFHGALSDDPDRAEEQLTKPFGGCTDERNPNPRPEDFPCWNPQRAIF